jgi:energy-coupling factor transport system substrate-specific component
LQRWDGLTSAVTANSWNALDSDVLYLSSATGVFSINTRNVRQNLAVPIARISGLFADGKPVYKTDKGFVIERNVQRVDIYIELLSFVSRDGTVSYMLEGFDNEIIIAGRKDISSVSYTNLQAGQYTFRLFGTNADGLQSETVIFTIHKEYAVLEMPFVRLLLALLGIGLLILGFRVLVSKRTKTLIRQKHEYKETAGQIMLVTAMMADSKNETMKGHSLRVGAYSKMVGARLGMTEDELETLYYAALLHDIGEVCLPDRILDKEGPLTDEEYETVKKHVTVGGDWLRDITVIGDIASGVRYHHERIDGKGYAEGLSGNGISMSAKIISVCNAFDSMLSDKPYRKALSIKEVQSEFISNAGTQFDEKITAVLISLIKEGEVPLC